MEQIIFIAIVLVVGLIRLLAQAAETKRNADTAKRAGAAPPSSAPRTEEERVRKFFDALGVPTSSAPPLPTIQPRPAVPAAAPKRQILPVDPFPKPRGYHVDPRPSVPAAPPPLPVTTAPPPLPARAAKSRAARESSSVAEFDVHNLEEDPLSEAGLRAEDAVVGESARKRAQRLVATPDSFRDAIVVREIFGPPRSMQPLWQR